MTAQISDLCILNQREFALVGVKGQPLFEPAAFGMRPVGFSTNCWRGYQCTYSADVPQLELLKLGINLQTVEKRGRKNEYLTQVGPAINGVLPDPKSTTDKHSLFNNYYANLHLPIAFSGGLLLGSDFIRDLYVHMGFHPAWKYTTVFEIVCQQGQIVERRDVSARVAEIREYRRQHPLKPSSQADESQLADWIADTFRLDYRL
jgi:hypothetical protein